MTTTKTTPSAKTGIKLTEPKLIEKTSVGVMLELVFDITLEEDGKYFVSMYFSTPREGANKQRYLYVNYMYLEKFEELSQAQAKYKELQSPEYWGWVIEEGAYETD